MHITSARLIYAHSYDDRVKLLTRHLDSCNAAKVILVGIDVPLIVIKSWTSGLGSGLGSSPCIRCLVCLQQDAVGLGLNFEKDTHRSPAQTE